MGNHQADAAPGFDELLAADEAGEIGGHGHGWGVKAIVCKYQGGHLEIPLLNQSCVKTPNCVALLFRI